MDKKRRSLGRDVFKKAPKGERSGAVKKMLKQRAPGQAEVKEVEVRVRLTPSNIKHLDALRAALVQRGKGNRTRSELIRVAITLLSADDF